MIITDGMAAATEPGLCHTAARHLEGIDFAGKTGTAQVVSHEALEKTGKGKEHLPNGWFVGVIPRRNPEFVVAVLWEHGDWGYRGALAAQVVTAYVNKKRRKATTFRRQQARSLSRWAPSGRAGIRATAAER